VDERRQDLLERNRAAACRSRAKKKNQMKNFQEQNSKLVAANKALVRVRLFSDFRLNSV